MADPVLIIRNPRQFDDYMRHLEIPGHTMLPRIQIFGLRLSPPQLAQLIACIKLNVLQTLSLQATPLATTDLTALAEAVAGSTSLQTFELRNIRLNNESIQLLAEVVRRSTSLQQLSLRAASIDNEGANTLAGAVANSTSLRELDLSINNIHHEGACALAQALTHNSSLQKLTLTSNDIGDAGIYALARTVATSRSLQMLALGGISSSPESIDTLAQAAGCSISLRALTLDNCCITSASAPALAETIRRSTALQALDLSNNQIGDTGTPPIARAAAGSTSLQALNLTNNAISDESAACLARMIDHNQQLQNLVLMGNELSDAGVRALADAIAQSPSLQTVDLRALRSGEEGARALLDAATRSISLTNLLQSDSQLQPQIEEVISRNRTAAATIAGTLERFQLFLIELASTKSRAEEQSLEHVFHRQLEDLSNQLPWACFTELLCKLALIARGTYPHITERYLRQVVEAERPSPHTTLAMALLADVLVGEAYFYLQNKQTLFLSLQKALSAFFFAMVLAEKANSENIEALDVDEHLLRLIGYLEEQGLVVSTNNEALTNKIQKWRRLPLTDIKTDIERTVSILLSQAHFAADDAGPPPGEEGYFTSSYSSHVFFKRPHDAQGNQPQAQQLKEDDPVAKLT